MLRPHWGLPGPAKDELRGAAGWGGGCLIAKSSCLEMHTTEAGKGMLLEEGCWEAVTF